LLRQMLDQLWQEWKALSSQIEATSQQIERSRSKMQPAKDCNRFPE